MNSSSERNDHMYAAPPLPGDGVFELISPELRETEEVLIICAGHPTNFIFQLAKYENDLKQLRADMSAFYNKEELKELAPKDIVKNKVYSACDVDTDEWYRVVVVDYVMGRRVPVRFCDYGEVTMIPISCMRELKAEFRKHPFMAIHGQLTGVKPLVENWALDDCLRFQDLVEDQLLAATVVGVLEKVNPMDRIVFLNLIDKSTDRNIDIADLLVSENRAVRDG